MNSEENVLDTAQATVLGNIMNDPSVAGDVFSRVKIEDFDGKYRSMAEAIHGLRLSMSKIDVLSVTDEMNRRGTLGLAGGAAEVHVVHGHWFGDVNYSAQVIARTARLRKMEKIGLRLSARTGASDADPYTLAKYAVEQGQGIIDAVEAEGDITTPSLGEFLDVEEQPYDWVIPGLLERQDRLVLTGNEGLGKSVLQRQLAVCAASGIHPLAHTRERPMRVLYIDCENGPTKLRRALRPLARLGTTHGVAPQNNMWLEAIPEGLDLTREEDEMWLVSRVSALQPDLLIVGPLYRLHAKNPNDEEVARKVTQVLDRCRIAANCAIITEAHAGHGGSGLDARPVRPAGSSLWLRWPEFGYGLRAAPDYDPSSRVVEFVPWRGDREERNWPASLRQGGEWPWKRNDGPTSYQEQQGSMVQPYPTPRGAA